MAGKKRASTPQDDADGSPRSKHEARESWPGAPFLDFVTFEQRRSERYNHYFAVVRLSSPKLSVPDLLRLTSSSLRASDLLGTVDHRGLFRWRGPLTEGPGEEPEQATPREVSTVALLFPETDREGAEVALRRISSKLTADEAVSFKYAIYPDDSTSPEGLLSIVAA